jgi:hypothetical protein
MKNQTLCALILTTVAIAQDIDKKSHTLYLKQDNHLLKNALSMMKKTLFIPLLALAFACKKKPNTPVKPEPVKPEVVEPLTPLEPSKIKVVLQEEPTYIRYVRIANNFGRDWQPIFGHISVATMKPVEFTLPKLRYWNGLSYAEMGRNGQVNLTTMKAIGESLKMTGVGFYLDTYVAGEVNQSFHPESLLKSYFLFEEVNEYNMPNGKTQNVQIKDSPIEYDEFFHMTHLDETAEFIKNHNSQFTEEQIRDLKCFSIGRYADRLSNNTIDDRDVIFDREDSDKDFGLGLLNFFMKYKMTEPKTNTTAHKFQFSYGAKCQKHLGMQELDVSKKYKVTFVYVRRDGKELKYSYILSSDVYLFRHRNFMYDQKFPPPAGLQENEYYPFPNLLYLETGGSSVGNWECSPTGYWYGTYQPGTEPYNYVKLHQDTVIYP